MSTIVPMTPEGEAKILAELERLEKQDRPRVTRLIAEARAHGDLSENAEYHAAKEEQALIEARVRDLKSKMAHKQVIDVTKLHTQDKVVFGSTIKITHIETRELYQYKIVGIDEADVKVGKISFLSPMARAAIGKSKGDFIEVNTPDGFQTYEINEVLYV